MSAYADSNFFTRLYLSLAESSQAQTLLENALRTQTAALPVTWLHRAEIINAFQLHVFSGRMLRHTRITAEQAAAAQAHFRDDLAAGTFMRTRELNILSLEPQFEEISLRQTARHGFRTYDIVHVASALLLECDTFWSFDSRASRLAALEGLRIIRR
jgi:predicted nucleic acid-binding protein